jgi:hypothetical protein
MHRLRGVYCIGVLIENCAGAMFDCFATVMVQRSGLVA